MDNSLRQLISDSNLYVESHYLRMYPDVAEAVNNKTFKSGFAHFINFGFSENRSPNIFFNQSEILSGDVDYELILNQYSNNLLLAYISESSLFKIKTFWFDEEWYLDRYADVSLMIDRKQIANGLEHYLNIGGSKMYSPNSWFDETWYSEKYNSEIDFDLFKFGFEHYVMTGQMTGFNPNVLFNEQFYLNEYPDIKQAIDDGILPSGARHYFGLDYLELRQPHELFIPHFYYENNKELINESEYKNPLVHYLNIGFKLGLAIHPLSENLKLDDELIADIDSIIPLDVILELVKRLDTNEQKVTFLKYINLALTKPYNKLLSNQLDIKIILERLSSMREVVEMKL